VITKKDKNIGRLKRHVRIRAKISGNAEKPRLSVYRSNANISAQIIDDVKGVTIVSASSLEASFEGLGSNKDAAKKVGTLLAQRALEKGINTVVFDRSGYLYHGRIAELAAGAREGGLTF
jgi:large subunit ribosomal protein L18